MMISSVQFVKVSSILIDLTFLKLEIVNSPVECDNPECGQLYCSYCLNMKLYDKNLQNDQKECEVCKKINGGYRPPSALIVKMLNTYRINCITCNKPFDMKNLV